MKRSWSLAVGVIAVVSLLATGPAAQGSHAAFAVGDVFVGVGSSTVQWRHSDTSSNGNLATFVNSPSTTGMVFDLAGKLYVTGFTSNGISRFNTDGSQNGAFGGSYSAHPKSMAVDAAGNIYVGLASGSKDVLKMSLGGNVLASYDVAISKKGGADWVDVASDQCTLLYTNLSNEVHRFDACSNTQMGDLATGLPGTAQEVRALLDGGALVATGGTIVRVDASGAIVQQYDAAGQNCWNNVTLGSTASDFWAADSCTSSVYQFSFSGDVLQSFGTGTRRNTIGGMAVFGGLRAATAGADLAVTKSTDFDQVSSEGTVQYLIGVTNDGPLATGGVTVVDTVSHGTIMAAGGGGWSCEIAAGGDSVTCSLAGVLAGGSSASDLEILVQAPSVAGEAILTNTATVSGDEDDPNAGNNTAEVRTTILDTTTSEDVVITFCPPEGCEFETFFDTNENNNTGNQVHVPGGGTGGITILRETDAPFACDGGDGQGQETSFDPPPGIEDRTNPIHIVNRYDVTLGELTGLCTRSKDTNQPVQVPACLNDSWANEPTDDIPSGLCYHKIHQLGNGDWQVHLHLTSIDPQYKR